MWPVWPEIETNQKIIDLYSREQLTYGSLKEKTVLKQYPLGTILENGIFFGKKGTILVPLVS